MTGTIINPIWFYLIDVADTVESVSGLMAIILGAVILIFGSVYLAEEGDPNEAAPWARKVAKCGVWAFVISLLLTLLIPSKDTMIEMMVAKYATYENAQSAVDAVKNAADYIVDAVLKIKGE